MKHHKFGLFLYWIKPRIPPLMAVDLHEIKTRRSKNRAIQIYFQNTNFYLERNRSVKLFLLPLSEKSKFGSIFFFCLSGSFRFILCS